MSAARSLPLADAPARWNHRTYGSISDPAHKSHMSSLIGEYACTEQFRRDRMREASGEERNRTAGKTAMGTAGHEVIRRAFAHPEVRARLLRGDTAFSPQSMRRVLEEEFARETTGREVIWYGKSDREGSFSDVSSMLDGLFRGMHRHVAEVVLCEAGWIAPAGKYWTEGHIDLVFRPRSNPTAFAITDWKTGADKPHQIELDHGFESGLYSNALHRGIFLPEDVLESWRAGQAVAVPLPILDAERLCAARDSRSAMHIALRSLAQMSERGESLPEGVVRFDEFPAEIWLTHLADYMPYERKGAKTVEREEDIEHWTKLLGKPIARGDKVNYESGMQRGPAWLRVRRTEDDVQRLEKRLSTIIGWVRLGLFVDAVGEKCTRCSHRDACLTTGYEARGDDAKALARMLKGIDCDEFASGMQQQL